MRSNRFAGRSLIVLLLVLLVACAGPSGPSIQVGAVWSRPALKMEGTEATSEGNMGQGKGMAGTGAVFMTLENKGGEADRLVGGQTDVARVVEIHETVMEGEVMKMQMLQDGLEIPAKDQVLLEPGGYHVMLIGITRDLEAGDTFSLELQFEKSGTIQVEPQVREP